MAVSLGEEWEEYAELRREHIERVKLYAKSIIDRYGANMVALTDASRIASWLGIRYTMKFRESSLFNKLKLTDPIQLYKSMEKSEFERKLKESHPDFTLVMVRDPDIIAYGGPETYLIYHDDPLLCLLTCHAEKCAQAGAGGTLEPLEGVDYRVIGCDQPVLYLEIEGYTWTVYWI